MNLSVSRRTDIPAFYSAWFFNRIKEGFVYTRNPFKANAVSRISLHPNDIDCIIFWTKNPSFEFIDNLHLLSDYNYYFQFTINPYDSTIEQNVPNKQFIIESFKNLSRKLGKERMIWRYDPILIGNEYTVDYHIRSFEQLLKSLVPYTEKCIISFIDFYTKSERNLRETSVRTLTESEIYTLVNQLQSIALANGLILETCAEEYDLSSFGIGHGKCIDDKLIERITKKQIVSRKDKNQRKACGCIESIDIGGYNTCQHNCLYCYANYSSEKVIENIKNHDANSPLLIGNIDDTDIIIERKL
jgi:DNA repair photolyase